MIDFSPKQPFAFSLMGVNLAHFEHNAKENAHDQGDRSLIFYFERGRDSGVKATSVFSSG